MTDSDTSGAAQPDAEDDAKKAAAERPGHRRSVFWDHQDRIRALPADGRRNSMSTHGRWGRAWRRLSCTSLYPPRLASI